MMIGTAWSKESNKVDAVILQDIIANSSEMVNVKHSNSGACKKPCTVKNYISAHLKETIKEIEKIKRTPKKSYEKVFGTSVSENDEYQISFTGLCSKEEKPNYPDGTFGKAGLKLPKDGNVLVCRLKFGFAFGENVWSEELQYIKNPETNAVISGSFWAVGTP
jgi:hypothetical protein